MKLCLALSHTFLEAESKLGGAVEGKNAGSIEGKAVLGSNVADEGAFNGADGVGTWA